MPQYPNLVIDADLSISGVGQLSNARIQNVTSAGRLTLEQELVTSEAAGNTHTGQIIFDVDLQTLFIFVSANSQFEPVSFNREGDVMFKGVINPSNANSNNSGTSGGGTSGTDSSSGVDSGGNGGTTTTTTTTTSGQYTVVGDRNADGHGAAFVYDNSDLTAEPIKLTPFDGVSGDQFGGSSIAVTTSQIIIGAKEQKNGGNTTGVGAVYVFDTADLSAQPTKLTASTLAWSAFGTKVDADDDSIIVGAPGEKSVYVFDANNLSSSPTKLSSGQQNFGNSLVLSTNHIVVGSSNKAFVYDRNNLSSSPTELTPPDPNNSGNFALSEVSISNGNLFVSANATSGGGTVHVYDLSNLSASPIALGPIDGTGFGSKFDASPTQVVIGQSTATLNGVTSAGRAYVYDATDLTAAPTIITAPADDQDAADYFGSRITVSETEIIVTAHGDDEAPGTGAVYVFDATDLTAAPTKLIETDFNTFLYGLAAAVSPSVITTTTSSGSGAGTDSTSAGIDSSTVDTSGGGVLAFSGFQYVVDTAGTLVRDGVTFIPNGQVEVGDIVLFTSETEAYVLQSNVSPATTTKAGTINLATQAAVDAGVIDSDAVTPATLAGSQLAAQVVLNTSAQNVNATDIANLQAFTGEGTALSSTATDLAAAINELVGRADSSATEIDGLEALVGEGTVLATAATSLAAGINELVARQDSSDSELDAIFSDLNSLQAFTGEGTSLDTTAADLAAAINELHGEIVTNASEIAANTSDIAPTTASILTNTNEIVANDSDLAALNTRLDEIDVDLSGVNDTITSLYTQIASNDADIATIVSTFGSNDTELANLAARMLTAEGNITGNDSDILALQTRVTSFEGNTSANDSDLLANAALISSLETYFGSDSLNTSAITLAGAINELHSDADANAAAILGNDSDILALQTLLGSGSLDTTATTLAGAMNELQSEITANDSDIAVLTGLISTVESSDDIKAFNQDNITFVADVEQTITHNLGLEFVTGFTIAVMDGTGDMIEATVRAIDSNSVGIMTEFDVSNASMFMLANLSAPATGDIPPGTVMTQSGGYVVTQGGVFVVLNGYSGGGSESSVDSGTDSSSPAPAPAPAPAPEPEPNDPPVISGIDASYTLTQGQDTVITGVATDPESDAITWSYEVISGDLAGTTVSQADNVFTVSHGFQDANFTLRFKATDSAGNETTHDASFALTYVNQAPTISGIDSAYTLETGSDTVITAVGTDPEGDAVTWSYEPVVQAASGGGQVVVSGYPNSMSVYDASDLSASPTVINAPAGDSYFGHKAVTNGSKLIVKSYSFDGRLYVYDANDLSAAPDIIDSPADFAGTYYFAGDLAIRDNKLVVSGGQNYQGCIYDLDDLSSPPVRIAKGDAVACSPTHIFVGEGKSGSNSQVFVYDLNTNQQVSTLTNINSENNDYFGKQVYANDTHVAISAYGENNQTGAVYLYDASDLSAAPVRLSPGDYGNEQGRIMNLSSTHLAISEENSDNPVNKAGAVHIYDLSDLSAGSATLRGTAFQQGFGYYVAFVGENDRIAIGSSASNTDTYIYSLSDLSQVGSFTKHVLTSVTPAPVSGLAGTTVSQSDNVFTVTPGTQDADFQLTFTATDDNGNASTHVSDFTYVHAEPPVSVVVGAQGDDDNGSYSGSVYIYDANDLTASPTKLTAFDGAAGDTFGFSVAATADKIVVGSYADDDKGSNSGSVYVYDKNDLSAQPTKLTAFDGAANDRFGNSVAATANKIVVGARGETFSKGAVYVYDANDLTAQSTKLTAFDGATYEYFGEAVAATADKIVVGAIADDNIGSVYVYDANDLTASPTKLTPFDGASNDKYGQTVAATSDKIIVGSWLDDDHGGGSGSVYVYDANDLTASPTKLTADEGDTTGDSFGWSVAGTSDKIVVGAFRYSTQSNLGNGYRSGAVYVYDANDLTASPTKLTAFDGAEEDEFGSSVAVNSHKIVVGASKDDDNGDGSGSVYVYDVNDLTASPTKLTAFDGAASDLFGTKVALG